MRYVSLSVFSRFKNFLRILQISRKKFSLLAMRDEYRIFHKNKYGIIYWPIGRKNYKMQYFSYLKIKYITENPIKTKKAIKLNISMLIVYQN
jgi:hypothetical protein